MSFYAARQPILNLDKSLYAYELLFREGLENAFPEGVGEDEATSKMIEGAQFNLGLDSLTQNKPAFINFTHDTLLKGYPLLLPHEQVVVEILETVKPGKKLLNACQELKDKGYTLALDDYEHQAVWRHFYPLVDIIKIDYTLTSIDEIKQIIQAIKPFPHIKLLAEKIENYEEFNQAVELGFEYFQGYFFSKPEVMESRSLTPSQFALTNLMAELSEEEPNMNKIAKAFESDVNLSFKLLRYTKSPLFQRGAEISTIKQAIVVLGELELKRFVSLLFSAEFTTDKPAALSIMSLLRAHFCETVASLPGQKEDSSSAFLVGLLSLLDAMLDADIKELIEKLPLADNIKSTLCGEESSLSQYIKLVKSLEDANWEETDNLCAQMNINEDKVAQLYKDSVEWVDKRLKFG